MHARRTPVERMGEGTRLQHEGIAEGTQDQSGAFGGGWPLWFRALARDWLAPFALLVLALALYVPGLASVPPLDRDEPRFAQASKQMMETGNYVAIRYQEEARNKKPVGIYWLQVAAAKLTGYDASAPIWVYRLPSILGAVAAVLLSYWAARAFLSAPAALLCGVLVALALILNVEARLAKTDAVLLACVVMAQGGALRAFLAWERPSFWSSALPFWLGLGFGTLVKGPIILMVCGLTLLTVSLWDKRAAWIGYLAPVRGVLIYGMLVAPWFVAIYLETKGQFFRDALGADLWAKVGQGKESHGAPPLTHLLAMLVVFWPIPSFLVLALPHLRDVRSSSAFRFLVSWIVPSWIVFELASTKLPHYTMPMMPAVALLSILALMSGVERPISRLWGYLSFALGLIVPVVVFVGVLVLPVAIEEWPSPPAAVLAGLAVIFAYFGFYRLSLTTQRDGISLVIIGGLSLFIGFWAFGAPAVKAIWVSGRLVEAIKEVPNCSHPQVASTGFSEPSFVFLQSTSVRLMGPEAAARFVLSQDREREGDACRVALVEQRFEKRFEAEVKKLGRDPFFGGKVKGLNINGGKELKIDVFYVNGGHGDRD